MSARRYAKAERVFEDAFLKASLKASLSPAAKSISSIPSLFLNVGVDEGHVSEGRPISRSLNRLKSLSPACLPVNHTAFISSSIFKTVLNLSQPSGGFNGK